MRKELTARIHVKTSPSQLAVLRLATARIHVKISPSQLAVLKLAADLAGADDFSTWVRDTLRKAAARALAKHGEPQKEAGK